jgi:putative tricarboxylic transport membrane protein
MRFPDPKAALRLAVVATIATAVSPGPSKATDISIAVPTGAGPNVEQLANAMSTMLEATTGTTARVLRGNEVPGGLGVLLLTSDQLAGAPDIRLSGLEPLALLTQEYQVMVVSPASDFGSLSDVIVTMRKRPDEVKWVVDPQSSAGIRAAILEILGRGGVDVTKVQFAPPKWGFDPEESLASNDVTLAPVSAVIDEVRSSALRGLAYTSSFRKDGFEVPTFDEQGLGASNYSWTAVMVDRNINHAERQLLAARIDQMVNTPEWEEWLAESGAYNYYIPGARLGSFFVEESKSVVDALAVAPSNFQ